MDGVLSTAVYRGKSRKVLLPGRRTTLAPMLFLLISSVLSEMGVFLLARRLVQARVDWIRLFGVMEMARGLVPLLKRMSTATGFVMVLLLRLVVGHCLPMVLRRQPALPHRLQLVRVIVKAQEWLPLGRFQQSQSRCLLVLEAFSLPHLHYEVH